MKDFIKYAIVGVVGYTIGFYEMKYKIQKVMLDSYLKKENEENTETK